MANVHGRLGSAPARPASRRGGRGRALLRGAAGVLPRLRPRPRARPSRASPRRWRRPWPGSPARARRRRPPRRRRVGAARRQARRRRSRSRSRAAAGPTPTRAPSPWRSPPPARRRAAPASLVHLTVEIVAGKLRATADVYPVPRNVWARIRNPEPGPVAHAFAEASIDAEVRTYLAPVPLVTATVERARNFEGDVVALACGDVDRGRRPRRSSPSAGAA